MNGMDIYVRYTSGKQTHDSFHRVWDVKTFLASRAEECKKNAENGKQPTVCVQITREQFQGSK